MNSTRIVSFISLILIVVISVAGVALAEERLVPKIDSFIILIDHSGSMFLSDQGEVPTKAKQAKDILSADTIDTEHEKVKETTRQVLYCSDKPFSICFDTNKKHASMR